MTAAKKAKTAEVFDFNAFLNPDAFKDSYEKASESLRNVAEFQKGALEAFVASAGVYARAVEQAASEQASFVKESFDDGAAAVKAAATASSVQEAMEIHNEFGRAAMEKNMTFAAKIADHWTAAAKEAADPLTKRYGEFVEMVQAYRP